MGKWLESWIGYLGSAWSTGAVALLLIAAIAFQGLLVLGLPLLLLQEVGGVDLDWWDWFSLSAIFWGPLFLGVQAHQLRRLPLPTEPLSMDSIRTDNWKPQEPS